jgi:hypothetical protein
VTKFDPVIETCTSTEEIGSFVGETATRVGTGLRLAGVTVKAIDPLVPPPGGGFDTET